MTWRVLTRQGTRYVLVGLVNTLAGVGSVLFAQEVLGLSPYVANASGYLLGISIGFLLNHKWTFRYSGPIHASALLYGAAFAGCYLLNVVVLSIALSLRWPAILAQAAAIAAYSISFFFMCKELVFARDERQPISVCRKRTSSPHSGGVAQ